MISNDVRYMLVGGIAVGYYGYPRATGDIDLWVDNTPKNGEAVAAVLTAFGLGLEDDFPSQFQEYGKIFRVGRPPLRIALMTGISGVAFRDCYPKRKKVQFDGIEMTIIDLEGLKANKRASGRHKDLNDLENLP